MSILNRNLASYVPTREQSAVVVSGIVSMGLEILAGRVIAPQYGSTIYTWGSIIGVSMLALSLGYHYGGKRSANINFKDLDRFLIYTSAYIVLIIYAGEMILILSSSLPVSSRYAALVPVTVLFGPPTYFLGYISPYAVQLSSKQVKGEASGHFYAVGTAGSIIGAFGTTFLLVPYLEVDHVYVLFATLALMPVVKGLKDRKLFLIPMILLVGVLSAQSSPMPGNNVYTDSTAYQELRVADSNGVRTLYLDNQPQSAVYLNGSSQYAWDYPKYFHTAFLMRQKIDKVLFIGGGGFVAPQRFAEENITVHAVEIDPGVVKAAKKYFNLSESGNLKVYNTDGRQFLQRTNHTYDVIYLDAYRKNQVPFHLTTREFMQLTHEKTDEEGVVVSNLISTRSGPGSQFLKAEYRTVSAVYDSVYFFPTKETPLAQNIELVASKNRKLTEQQLRERNRRWYPEMDLSEQIDNLEQMETGDAPLLRDDYAPVERLLDPLVGQKYVLD